MLYAQSGLCRWRSFEGYFENNEEINNCGHCDNCVDPPEQRLNIELPHEKLSDKDEQQLLRGLGRSKERFKPGDVVKVPKFGDAEVTVINGDRVEVTLAGGERRTFKADYLKKRRKPAALAA